MDLEEGAVLSLRNSDGEWTTGLFLGILEEAGQEWYVLDIGRPSPRRINSGFVTDIEVQPEGDILKFPKKKKEPIRRIK